VGRHGKLNRVTEFLPNNINQLIMKVAEIMASLERKHGHEKEFLQAVHEVLESIEGIYNQHPEFQKAKIIERPN